MLEAGCTLALASDFNPGSCLIYSLPFVTHELPQAPTRAIFKEAARLLRPGGTFVL